jgi:hypothetical protein
MCSMCETTVNEIEKLEKQVLAKLARGFLEFLSLEPPPEPPTLELVQEHCERAAGELLDQVLYESPEGTEHHLAVVCNLADVADAWLRTVRNL